MKCYVVDANVMLLTGTRFANIPDEQLICYQKCVAFIRELMKSESCIVFDDRNRVIQEYRNAFRLEDCPNPATVFFQWALQHGDFIRLNETEPDTFWPYPDSRTLSNFDPPDRKYIALAYNHPQKPPIIEATDSKWWGIRKALDEAGIPVIYVDAEYIAAVYERKIAAKRKQDQRE